MATVEVHYIFRLQIPLRNNLVAAQAQAKPVELGLAMAAKTPAFVVVRPVCADLSFEGHVVCQHN